MSQKPVKKFINLPEKCVADNLLGLVVSDPAVCFSEKNFRVILRSDLSELKSRNIVSLLAGGGSGHEPFAAGYVGKNGLTTAVAGDVFASPSSEAVYNAIEEIYTDSGSIVYVINYTGDRLNFGMAVERFKAERKVENIDLVYIDDDVALEDKTGSTIGGRGLGGAVLLIQVVGYLAEQKKMPFKKLLETSREIVKNTATFGVSLMPCAIPGKPRMFELKEDEMELGLGIHGEPGSERTTVKSAKDVVGIVLRKLTTSKRLNLKKSDKLIVFLNNLGSTSVLEMNILSKEVVCWLAENGFYQIERLVVGTGMTSIDGHGFSISVVKTVEHDWVEAFEQKSAISRHFTTNTKPKVDKSTASVTLPKCIDNEKSISPNGVKITLEQAKKFEAALLAAAEAVKTREDELNKLDGCGDGDCGTTLKTAAEALNAAAKSGKIHFSHPQTAFLQIARVFEKSVGGTTGAIYAMLLTAGSACFEQSCEGKDVQSGLKRGLEAVMKYGHARPGHRTLVDPLDAAIRATDSLKNKDDWEKVVKAAEKSANETAKMEAKSGRASYTTVDQQTHPDPGAVAVAAWMRAVFESFYP